MSPADRPHEDARGEARRVVHRPLRARNGDVREKRLRHGAGESV